MPSVTICVLTYGDFLPLVKTAIESILANCERPSFRLVIGANAIGSASLRFLRDLASVGVIHRLYVSTSNINKCPMMRWMFSEIDTEFIWWFDDDSYVVDRDALRARVNMAHTDPPEIAIWGHQFYFGHERDFSYETNVVEFVRQAPWYRGKEPPSWLPGGKGEFNFEDRATGDGRWFFVTGGCWFARTAALKALDWPDHRLVKRNDDVLLCEALRQQNWRARDIGSLGVAINTYPRRGGGEDPAALRAEIRQPGRVPGCLFLATFRDADLLLENFGGRPDLATGLDIHVLDDNFEEAESARVEQLCRQNGWHYRRSNRGPHDTWEADQTDLSGFNRVVWESMTSLGLEYEYVIKIDTDAYPIEAGWHREMAELLSGRNAIAGTLEYRPAKDVMSFWNLASNAGYPFDVPEHVPHVQGGIYGLSRSALRKLREMGFLAGKHEFFAEDCYMSYACWLLGIDFFETTKTGSWFKPYRPPLDSIAHLKAIHPLTRGEWADFLRRTSQPGRMPGKRRSWIASGGLLKKVAKTVAATSAPAEEPRSFLVEWPQASTPFGLFVNATARKVNLRGQWRPPHHRSGWGYLMDSLEVLDCAEGVLLDGFIEKKFAWDYDRRNDGPAPYREPWIGFVHNPPLIPAWFNPNQQSPVDILRLRSWRESMRCCKGLFTLSSYLKEWLAPQVPVPVCNLLAGTETPGNRFSISKYLLNPDKKILHIGWWLRKFHSMYHLPVTKLKKVLLRVGDSWINDAHRIELGFVRDLSALDSVEVVSYLRNEEYDELLSKNVVFLDLYDNSFNNTIVECIVRATPLLINRLPAVVEYLGDGYPFYFESLREAALKAEDETLVALTHEYLEAYPLRKRLTREHFLQSFVESSIYQNLPLPPSEVRRRAPAYATAETVLPNLPNEPNGTFELEFI